MGLGVRRLPLTDDKTANINEAESIKIIRCAVDRGVNYLELGYPYDMSRHEHLARVVSQALEDGYRQKLKLAITLPSFLIDSPPDFGRYLNEQLEWLQMDKVDFCLLGRLNRDVWPRLKELDALGWAEKAMASGLIGQIGFSFHDYFQALREILDDYDNWALGQFQYSYMDVDHHPGVSGLKYAADKGLAVVVTEPLRGGRITKKPPQPVAKIWANATQKRTLAEWGLSWVWNHPEVSTVVSDMSTIEHVMENAALADSAEADSLTVQEEVLISQVREAYRKLRPIPCTACRGCMPCPQDIDVPRIFEIYNDAIMYDDVGTARALYQDERHAVDDCTECAVCVDACARKIDILEWLKKADKLLARAG